MYIAYSYLYARARTPPEPWYEELMKTYFEEMVPKYFMNTLGTDITVYPAPYAVLPNKEEDMLDYFMNRIRPQLISGNDSVVIMTDILNLNQYCPRCAGENFYLERPNVAWASVYNWEDVRMYPNLWPEMVAQLGRGDGIYGFVTAQHEMTHYVLLELGGVELSRQIDGGRLSGLVFVNDNLTPDPRGRWVFQRVRVDQPFHSKMGAYE